MNEEKLTYFQYFKDYNYPLTIGLNMSSHHKEIVNSLELIGFSEISREEWSKLKTAQPETTHVDIKSPSPLLAHSIGSLATASSPGKESLASKNGCRF